MTRKFGTAPQLVNVSSVNVQQWANGSLTQAQPDSAEHTATGIVIPVLAELALLNPVSATWERWRTSGILRGVRTFNVNAAINVWTPAAGKKFRLMGYRMMLSGNASLA